MGRLIARWLVLTLSLIAGAMVTERLMGGITVRLESALDFFTLMVCAVVLSLVNATLGNLIKFFTLPLTCLTLGLFTLVVNGAMLMLVGQFGLGLEVTSFFSAVVASILVSIINGLFQPGDKKKKDDD